MATGPKICTRSCTGEYGAMGCPIGFDCRSADGMAFYCLKATYTVDGSGTPVLYSKGCQQDGDCMSSGDSNPHPTCRKALDPTSVFGPYQTPSMPLKPLPSDPGATCTGSCTADSDCPINYFCGPDYDQVTKDPSMFKCIKRTICDSCHLNDECPADFPNCIPDSKGAHYCTKSCNTSADCPGIPQGSTYLHCLAATDAAGTNGKFCTHAFGSCNGTGNICDPCRNEFDCAGQSIAGLHCLFNTQTLERMCTKVCRADSDCGGPNNTQCDNTVTTPPSANDICYGPGIKAQAVGVLSCHI
jgi:hypothetical protein